MDEILTELKALRGVIAGLLTTTPDAKCQGVTGKGTPCKNRAVGDSGYCRMHGERPERAPKPVRARAPPKPKKVQPEHTHGIGESAEGCRLCATHGDVWNPTLPDDLFCEHVVYEDGCTV
jgi:hypothetical protein